MTDFLSTNNLSVCPPRSLFAQLVSIYVDLRFYGLFTLAIYPTIAIARTSFLYCNYKTLGPAYYAFGYYEHPANEQILFL